MPSGFGRYFEPFVGGGALFFDLNKPGSYIADVNPELINTYQVVAEDVETLIDKLEEHAHQNSKDHYHQVRDMDRSPAFAGLPPIDRAARFIYLNKTCFNGIHRVNSKGHNNVPYNGGNFAIDEDSLREGHLLLRETTIELASYDTVVTIAQENDFVYFDPPYFPISNTSSFTSYERDGFTREDHENLVKVMNVLRANGVHVMVSNSWCSTTIELYEGYNQREILASRMVNANGDGRGKISEMLAISSYRHREPMATEYITVAAEVESDPDWSCGER